MAQDKIMIVDDEQDLVQLIRLHLTHHGFDVVYTCDSASALSLFEKERPNLVLLDVMMAGLNGYELCVKLREISSVPILFLSCKGSETDKVTGLSIGGDDYITKPFGLSELTARIQAQLRRSRLSASEPAKPSADRNAIIHFGALQINTVSYSVTVSGTELTLTAKEFELLCLLARYPDRVFTAKQIFDALWNPYGLENDTRTVSVHISNLRKKLEHAAPSHQYIRTVRGIGYKMVPDTGGLS